MVSKNIIIFSDSFYPIIDGVVRFVDRLALSLHHSGYEVTLVIPKYTHKTSYITDSRPYDFMFLPTIPLYIKGYYPVLPLPALYTLLSDADLLIINSLAFTTMYAQFINNRFQIPMIEFVHADEKVVINSTAGFPQILKGMVFKMLAKMTSKVDYFAVATNTFERRTLAYGVDRSKIFRVPFGYKLHKFTNRSIIELQDQYGIDSDKTTVLYLGRLSDEKNIDTIVDVMGYLSRKGSEIQYIIAGGGYRYEDLKKEISDNKYQIILTGRLPDHLLPPLYSTADIFYSPSDHEALCFTVIEAMHYGAIPIVNGKFNEDQLTAKNSVLLNDIHNEEEGITKIQELISDQNLLTKMQKEVKNSSKQFTWDKFDKVWAMKISEIFNQRKIRLN